jgi:hypothetical protein
MTDDYYNYCYFLIDFTRDAKQYGKIIISEKNKKERTLLPLNLGGIAGGKLTSTSLLTLF